MIVAAASAVAPSSGFWLTLLIGCIPVAIALGSAAIWQFRHRGEAKREDERREDTLWGYTDSTGIRHIGAIEGQMMTQKKQGEDIQKIFEILDRGGLT